MVNEINPVTIEDIISFINQALLSFEDPIFLSFTLMITFAVALAIRRILVGVKQ